MDKLLTLIGRVPTIVWIIAGIIVVFPCARRALRGAGKFMGIIAIVLALCFIFPSIVSSFMDNAKLTYNAERKSITNRNGVEISWDDIVSKGKQVKDIIDTTGEVIDDVQEVKKQIKDIGSDIGEQSGAISDSYIEIVITDDMIEKANENGITLTKDSVITVQNNAFYLKVNNNYLLLSDDFCKALGLK